MLSQRPDSQICGANGANTESNLKYKLLNDGLAFRKSSFEKLHEVKNFMSSYLGQFDGGHVRLAHLGFALTEATVFGWAIETL